MKLIFSFLLVLVSPTVFSQARIIDCALQDGNGSSSISVILTDTVAVNGINIKVGSAFDGTDLLNEQYLITSLPGNASLVENTFSVIVDEINTSPKYLWVTLMLSGGGSKEIKLTKD